MDISEINWDNNPRFIGPDGDLYPFKPYDTFEQMLEEASHQPGYIRRFMYKSYLSGYQDGVKYGRED